MSYCRHCWNETAGRRVYCSPECRRADRRTTAYLRRVPAHVSPRVAAYLRAIT